MIPDPDPEAKGRMLEPIEECTVLMKEEYAGSVVQTLTMRKGEMNSYDADEIGWVKVVTYCIYVLVQFTFTPQPDAFIILRVSARR